MELTDQQYDIIVTDPPPPIESSGVSVISSLEYYRAGHDRLNPGGIMMQWVPYGQTIDEFRAHVRTFADVFSNVLVLRGPGGYGFFMMGSDQPMAFSDATVREVLARPGILEDISGAYDSPQKTVDGWSGAIPGLIWLEGGQVASFAGSGSAHHGRPAAAGVLPAAPDVRGAVATRDPGEPARGRSSRSADDPFGAHIDPPAPAPQGSRIRQ